MDIGGHDVSLPGPSSNEDLKLFCVLILLHWPGAVWQEASGVEGVALHSAKPIFLEAPEEYFFYRTLADFYSWTSDGRTDQNAGSMVHLFLEEDALSLVAESKNHPILVLATKRLEEARKVRP